jgi:hypothetical protein
MPEIFSEFHSQRGFRRRINAEAVKTLLGGSGNRRSGAPEPPPPFPLNVGSENTTWFNADEQLIALFMRAGLFKKLNVEPDHETNVIASLLTFNWFHLQVYESLSVFVVYIASVGARETRSGVCIYVIS